MPKFPVDAPNRKVVKVLQRVGWVEAQRLPADIRFPFQAPRPTDINSTRGGSVCLDDAKGMRSSDRCKYVSTHPTRDSLSIAKAISRLDPNG